MLTFSAVPLTWMWHANESPTSSPTQGPPEISIEFYGTIFIGCKQVAKINMERKKTNQ